MYSCHHCCSVRFAGTSMTIRSRPPSFHSCHALATNAGRFGKEYGGFTNTRSPAHDWAGPIVIGRPVAGALGVGSRRGGINREAEPLVQRAEDLGRSRTVIDVRACPATPDLLRMVAGLVADDAHRVVTVGLITPWRLSVR